MATHKKSPEKSKTKVSKAKPVPVFFSRAERLAAGKALRSSHATWNPPPKHRPDCHHGKIQ